jgi:protein-tyrosine phosphatase
MIKVLFVCLGNICRSPLAAGVFNQKINQMGLSAQFQADSCGTSDYHIGELADERTIACALNHEIKLDHRARQIQRQDFKTFDYILVMDKNNQKDVKHLTNRLKLQHANILLMRSFQDSPESLDVPDPYYGTMSDFETVHKILEDSINRFIAFLKSKEYQGKLA